MNRKPDVIRMLLVIFVLGLVTTGFTSLQASEQRRTVAPAGLLASPVAVNAAPSFYK